MAAHATIEQPTLTPEQEQEKWLGEALKNVKEKAAYLRAAVKQGQFVPMLRFSSQLLTELRTGMLTPQNYYELYVKVFDELQDLEQIFTDELNKGRSIDDMYETVQHAGNIVPRLYLLFTVGAVYIRSKKAPVRELLMDMVELCKGVQHPTRGLFLRNYLLTLTKHLLPDTGNEFDDENGNVADSVNFILQNFKEMVWLWVRMDKLEHMSKQKREKERKELRILVASNLVRLSQLEGVTRSYYGKEVLPSILSIILSYKDVLAQQSLFDALIQVFPDEYHLLTLTDLLQAFGSTVPGVNVHTILISLMDRLGNYVASLRDGTAEGGSKKEEKVIRNMFTIFQLQISELASKGIFSAQAYSETQNSLMKLVLKTYPGEWDRVDEILEAMKTHFTTISAEQKQGDALISVRKLLVHLIEQVKDPNVVLDLANFDHVVDVLNFKNRRDVAMSLCSTAVQTGVKITSLERVARLFDIIAPLVRDVEDTPSDKAQIYTIEPEEEFAEEQRLVCRVIHLIDSDDMPMLMKMYSGVRKQLGQGGTQRMAHTLKAMSFLYVRLAIRCKKLEAQGVDPGVPLAKPFQYIYTGDGKGILEILCKDAPMDTFPMFLTCANAADTCELVDLSYDLYTEAFTIYEEQAADSKGQTVMLSTMISSLCALRAMPEESYDIVATKVCQYSSRLLKKHDQCRMAALCSHLFWKKVLSEQYHKKVMDCMQRSMKISDNCAAAQQLALYVELLNQFLYYYAAQTPGATVKYIASLIDLISASMRNADDGEVDAQSKEESKAYFKLTRRYIIAKQQVDDRWTEIVI